MSCLSLDIVDRGLDVHATGLDVQRSQGNMHRRRLYYRQAFDGEIQVGFFQKLSISARGVGHVPTMRLPASYPCCARVWKHHVKSVDGLGDSDIK